MLLLAYEFGLDGNGRDHLIYVELLLFERFDFLDDLLHLCRREVLSGVDSVVKDLVNVVQVKHRENSFNSFFEHTWISSFLLRAGKPLQKWGKQDEEDTALWIFEEFPHVVS